MMNGQRKPEIVQGYGRCLSNLEKQTFSEPKRRHREQFKLNCNRSRIQRVRWQGSGQWMDNYEKVIKEKKRSDRQLEKSLLILAAKRAWSFDDDQTLVMRQFCISLPIP
jgi:alkylated DNA repair dioxygenase AlkB